MSSSFPAKPGPVENQRQFGRAHVSLPAMSWQSADAQVEERVNIVRPSRARNAFVIDLSVSGLFLMAELPYGVGSEVWIRFRLGTQTLQLKATVRRVTPLRVDGRRSFGCGVQFVRCEQVSKAIPVIAQYLRARQVDVKSGLPVKAGAASPSAVSSPPGS